MISFRKRDLHFEASYGTVTSISSVSAQSFFLFGPRGTGKSTWLHQVPPDAVFLDLLRADLGRELAAKPERLVDLPRGSAAGSTVVVDEIQRVPELLNVIHALLESPDRRRFVMTGSSARKLRRGGVDLLAGRAAVRTMHPFMAAELLDDSVMRNRPADHRKFSTSIRSLPY